VEARPESENRADARGVRRKLGRTEGVLGTNTGKRVTRSNNTLAPARRFPRAGERTLEIDLRDSVTTLQTE
jgi:hypothetical protein